MRYHYSRQEGWLGNPCGLVLFKDKYHLFFLYNPDSPRYGPLHWGHAVSDDLISWEELPSAISPEGTISCNSGSVIEHDGKLFIFYTSVLNDMTEKICAVYSEDGQTFRPVRMTDISARSEGVDKLRDPFIFRYGNGFRMLTGAGKDGLAKVRQYESEDLISWRYIGELLSDGMFGSVIEAPELIEVDGRWVFIIQSERHLPVKVLFAAGVYDGERFVFDDEKEKFKALDLGEDFLNPVTGVDEDGNVILMSWLFAPRMNLSAISCPRIISVSRKGEICMNPYPALKRRMTRESSFVSYDNGRLRISYEGRTHFEKAYRECPEISVLEDIGTVEVFLNGGTETVSVHIC